MNGGLAPFLLIGVTMGLMLGVAPPRPALIGLIAFAGAALLTGALPVLLPIEMILVGLFLTVVAIAATLYLPVRQSQKAVVPLSISGGAWAGACAAATNDLAGMAIGLVPVLLAIPVGRIAQRNFSILIKVAASWMIAIASLSLFVSLVPTPGYKPDHME